MGRSRAVGKRRGGPWYGEGPSRLRFERNTTGKFPDLRGRTNLRGPQKGRFYTLTLDVPYYDPRRIEIWFRNDRPQHAEVRADGPTSSPHRYDKHRLCMWYPDDPLQHRWVFRDGLLCLLGMTSAHLFREAWWRETTEWLGPEVAHSGDPKVPAEVDESL